MKFFKLFLILTGTFSFSWCYAFEETPIRGCGLNQSNPSTIILPLSNGKVGQVLGLLDTTGQLSWITTLTNTTQNNLLYSATSAAIPLTLALRDLAASFSVNNLIVAGTGRVQSNLLVTGSVVGSVFYKYPALTAVSRTVQNKLNDWVDIKDFGAQGDGITNDFNAFVNALNILSINGGQLHIPKGTYLLTITGTITLPNNVTISGDGRHNTILQLSNAMVAPTVFLMNNATGVVINDLGLVINSSSIGSNDTVTIIQVGPTCNNFTLNNVQFNGNMTNVGSTLNYFAYGLNFPSTGTQNNFFINQCEMNNLYYPFFNAGTNSSQQKQISVLDSTFYNNYASDIYLNNPLGTQSNILIDGCTIKSNLAYLLSTSGIGIDINSGSDIRIINNYISGVFYNAVHLEQNISNFVVQGNILTTDGWGIVLMANNNPSGGTYYMPQNGTIQANSINLTGTTIANPRGISLFLGPSGIDPAQNTLIVENVISGSYYIGLEDGCSIPSMSIVKENLIQGAIIGFNFIQGGYYCDQNISSSCSIGIQGTNASVTRHTFHDCIITASATSQPLEILNPLVEFDIQTLLVSTTQFPLFRLGPQDRLSAKGAIYVRGTTNANAYSTDLVNILWTGEAFSAIPLITLESGTFISTFTRNNNMLALQITSTMLTSNVAMEVSLNGIYVMSS